MNGASARRRPRRARVVPPDPNARALVIEREVTDDLDRPPASARAGTSFDPTRIASEPLETHPTRTRADVTRRA